MLWAGLIALPLTLGIPECRELDARHVPVAAPPEAGARSTRPERVGTVRNAAWLALRAYQVVISPADGAGCTMYPSCSTYAIRAVRREGPLLGAFMATSRILRQHRHDAYPLCRAGDRYYHHDPPEEDAWWRSSR